MPTGHKAFSIPAKTIKIMVDRVDDLPDLNTDVKTTKEFRCRVWPSIERALTKGWKPEVLAKEIAACGDLPQQILDEIMSFRLPTASSSTIDRSESDVAKANADLKRQQEETLTRLRSAAGDSRPRSETGEEESGESPQADERIAHERIDVQQKRRGKTLVGTTVNINKPDSPSSTIELHFDEYNGSVDDADRTKSQDSD